MELFETSGPLTIVGNHYRKKEQLVDTLTAAGFVLEENVAAGGLVALIARRPGEDE